MSCGEPLHSAPRSRNVGINSITWLKIIALRWLNTRWKRNLILHMMKKFFFRKLQFSGSGVQFSSLGKFAEIQFFVHNLGQIYRIELVECSMEAEFNPTYDREK